MKDEELIDPLMAEMQEVLLQEKKREMAEKLKRTMVDSLIRQFLEPLNLQVNYELTKDNGVRLSIRQTKETTLDLSLDKIAEVLSDTDGLLQSMEVVNPEKESEKRRRPHHSFRIISDKSGQEVLMRDWETF